MKNNFDIIFNRIIKQENLNNIIYSNISLGIIPYKFKIPNKADWDLIMQYFKLPIDKLIIIISNVSKEKVINRVLSKTNLTKFSNILDKIQKNTDIDIINIKQEILNNIDNLSYKDLLYYCNNDIIPLLDQQYQLKDKLIKYLNNLKDTLFKNINELQNKKQITAQLIKQILQIYANTYNVLQKIQIIISTQKSPFNDMINIITTNCNDCDIYINVNDEKNNTLINDLYKTMKLNNNKNMIISYKINNYDKFDISNNNLDRKNFPNKLSQDDFNKIKDLLKNE